MNDKFGDLIEEAIKVELYASDLYMLFYRKFPEDAQFWWQLAMEEQNHAALLKTVRQMNSVELKIPPEILPASIQELIQSNNRLKEAIKDFEERPDREKAFHFAYLTEHSAGELHYDTFMKHAVESKLASVFIKLNGEDINHAKRIEEYMTEHDIPLPDLSDAGL
jgi:ferritin